MEGSLGEPSGKMGHGLLRYSPNPIACIIDSTKSGRDLQSVIGLGREIPIVDRVADAEALGAEVFVLGISPTGGLIPEAFMPTIEEAVSFGMSIVNGLHDRLQPRFQHLSGGQWIWDIRVEPPGLGVGTGSCRNLVNRRVLFIGTDMAVGKMTAGLELLAAAERKHINAAFVATGQIGIAITGCGVPLDAVRVDYASGAIEQEVLKYADASLVIIEGQGSLLHPGSSATLPLIRGSCPTDFVICHRAQQAHLLNVPWVKIPNLREFAGLYEELAEACGAFRRPSTVAIALNTSHLDEREAADEIANLERQMRIPVCDPVRQGGARLLEALRL